MPGLTPRATRRKRVGIIELLTDTRTSGWIDHLYARVLTRQFASITPQAVAIWCRQLGHHVHYTTYYGQADPRTLVPPDLDVLFVSAYTRSSGVAYALAKLFGRSRTLTVIGGPHAKAYAADCARYFDVVVLDCDKALIADIVSDRFDPPSIVTSGRMLTDIPTVEERLPDLAAALFDRGRPTPSTMIGLLSMASLATVYTENHGHLEARTTEYAQDKMEQLLAIAYGDVVSNTVTFPAQSSGGTGLAVGGSTNTAAPVNGYVDWLAYDGTLLFGGTTAPSTWFYQRVWQVECISASCTNVPAAGVKRITVVSTVKSSVGKAMIPKSTVVALKASQF